MWWPMTEFPQINVHSYIGVIIAISGNILISIALNIQKYAHNQLLPGVNSDAKLLHTTPTYIVEEELVANHNHYENHRYQPIPTTTTTNEPYHHRSSEDDHDVVNDRGVSFHSSQGSRQSSTHSHHSNHSDHNSDTSIQTETIAGNSRVDINEIYSTDADADTASEMLYLRSKAWWLGMTLMIVGECGNFLAYGYAQASIIAPLGTVALVSNVILAPLMLKEPFRKRDLLGIVIAIFGTIVVVINSKENDVKLTPEAVVTALLQTQFIVYFLICCVAVAILASFSDAIGSKYIFIDLMIVGIFGGYTVLATKGLSSLISLSFYKMFTYPIAYLLVFVLVTTAVLQIKFLNKSLQRFDSTQVIPTQFVLFTTSAIVGSGLLYNDFDEMDFQKGFNFVAGCLMTFLGVYFITSRRDKDELGKLTIATAELAMSPQAHFHRPSLDSFRDNRDGATSYLLESNRTDSLMEQGRAATAPVQNTGYSIPQSRSRHSIAAEAIGPSAPLLGTSNRHSISGAEGPIALVASALAAVGSAVSTQHPALFSIESQYGRRFDERRGSIQSLSGNNNNNNIPQQPRPKLGSRASSTCSYVLSPPSMGASATDFNYGTSLQSTPFHQYPRPGNSQAPDRSHTYDSHGPKKSYPYLSKGRKEGKGAIGVKPTSDAPGVAIPRWRGDRSAFPTHSEQDFVAGVAQSLDSSASLTAKAPLQFLPGVIFSTSPPNHGVQGSEHSIHTIKRSSGSNMDNSNYNNNTSTNNNNHSHARNNSGSPSKLRGGNSAVGSGSVVYNDQTRSASLPPIPPAQSSDSGLSHHQQQQQQQQQYPRKKKTRGSVISAGYDLDTSGMPMYQTKHKPSEFRDEDDFDTHQ
ncbi:hypothetical protein BGZ65_003140 [Modicella reniformis]|uniref:DUF803-domain-containing protein n=1 Tax=Modicella reniformis TaxID=1440133 RepID=A0A9P6SM91_9FUNG|nr:hypothetical protein BGZ65_003140 [Modicella reniformis]